MNRVGRTDRRLIEQFLEESRANGLVPSKVELRSVMTPEEQDRFFEEVSALGVPDSDVEDFEQTTDSSVRESVNPILGGVDEEGDGYDD